MKNIYILFFAFMFSISLYPDKIYNEGLNYFQYERVIDGDTFVISIKNIYAVFGDNLSVRIRGIDAPEKKERAKYNKSKKALKKLLGNGKNIKIKNISRGKYFRIIADVYVGDINVGEYMIKNRYAEIYKK